MSLPPLRKPKTLNNGTHKKLNSKDSAVLYVIVTLKTDKKLVIPSDAYHGIFMTENTYKCVFCDYSFGIDQRNKELHISSGQHHKMLESFPHIEEYAENLLRQITKDNFYCTICNAMVSQFYIRQHLCSETHNNELNKAINRAAIYKPVQ